MIHAFLAGFAGCIGVLVACLCWSRCNEWMAGRRIAREARRFRRELEAPPEQKSAHQREWESYAARAHRAVCTKQGAVGLTYGALVWAIIIGAGLALAG